MTSASRAASAPFDRNALRHAIVAERMRARHYHMELASALGDKLRCRCGRQLDASLGRAAVLTLALIDMGEAIPASGLCAELDDRLLHAMDANLLHAAPANARRRRSRSKSGVGMAKSGQVQAPADGASAY